MTTATVALVRWVAYALLIISIVPIGLSIPQFRKARSAPYYAIRRDALKLAVRWMWAALALLALAAILLVVAPRLIQVVSAPTPVPTATQTSVPIPTHTPRSTNTPTVTPTRRPTATAPPIPTPTSAVPLPEPALSPLPSAVPASPDAHIELQSLAMEKDASGLPVDPGNEFPPGDHWVYLFFTYEGMQNGVARTFAWYKDGEFLERCSDTGLWEWGDHGRTWYRCPGVWEPGTFEIHVFIETRLQGVAQFVITE